MLVDVGAVKGMTNFRQLQLHRNQTTDRIPWYKYITDWAPSHNLQMNPQQS